MSDTTKQKATVEVYDRRGITTLFGALIGRRYEACTAGRLIVGGSHHLAWAYTADRALRKGKAAYRRRWPVRTCTLDWPDA